jgi:hypothetical protein
MGGHLSIPKCYDCGTRRSSTSSVILSTPRSPKCRTPMHLRPLLHVTLTSALSGIAGSRFHCSNSFACGNPECRTPTLQDLATTCPSRINGSRFLREIANRDFNRQKTPVSGPRFSDESNSRWLLAPPCTLRLKSCATSPRSGGCRDFANLPRESWPSIPPFREFLPKMVKCPLPPLPFQAFHLKLILKPSTHNLRAVP